jgi:hypothetical protein
LSYRYLIPLIDASLAIGINKPGGAARIRSINSDGSYSVTYILGGKEDHIDIAFITRREENEGRPKRSRNSLPYSAPVQEEIKKSTIQKKARSVLSQRSTNAADEVQTSSSVPSPPPRKQQQPVMARPIPTVVVNEVVEMESEAGEADVQSTPTKARSELTQSVIQQLLPALRRCRETEDGGYLVADIKKALLGSLGGDAGGPQAFEEALSHFEAENVVMIMPSDGGPDDRVLFVI